MKDKIETLYEFLRDEVFSKVNVLKWYLSDYYKGKVKIEYKSPAGEWHYIKFRINPVTYEISQIKRTTMKDDFL